jgi:hypothetical protein
MDLINYLLKMLLPILFAKKKKMLPIFGWLVKAATICIGWKKESITETAPVSHPKT